MATKPKAPMKPAKAAPFKPTMPAKKPPTIMPTKGDGKKTIPGGRMY